MNHQNNNQKKPEAKLEEGPKELTTLELEKAIIQHAYDLEELKTRDYGKLLTYVRKHRASKLKNG